LTNRKAAIDIIENLRTKVDSNELRTSYFATVQDIYKLHIDILMQLHKQNPSKGYDAQALATSEKSRARGLLELLTEANADIRKDVNPELVAQEKQLQQLINSKEKLRLEIVSDKNKSNDLISKAAAQRFKKEVQNHIYELNQLKAKIKTTSPKYAKLKYPEPLNLNQIQQQLDKDTVLLQYSLGEKRSYLWKVTPNSLDSYELPKSEEIEETANKLRNLLQDPSTQNRSPEETSKAATELSKLILTPVANQLGKKRLVIVGDDALQYIPFAALTDLNAQSQEKQTDVNYQPLLINHEIVHLPSASTIDILRKETAQRPIAPKTLAVLADPVFCKDYQPATGKPCNDKNIDIDVEAYRSSDFDKIDSLPHTRKEAEEILKLVSPANSLQAFDFDANYNWATQKQLSNYRYLHFATHGFVDTENPQLSGIVLSLFDKQGNPQKEGFLRLHELFNLNFPAELVVLSACQTGLGKEVKGEGLVGLTRGLMYAGAERVVLSLWKVKDDSTSLLMRQFYQEMLQQGKSPASALREAQIKMWQTQEWRNPYYWAAFTIQGEWKM
ncbi:MAG: CHAT domain-containing protein, partial [Cyanobacteria bacterium J06635_10]